MNSQTDKIAGMARCELASPKHNDLDGSRCILQHSTLPDADFYIGTKKYYVARNGPVMRHIAAFCLPERRGGRCPVLRSGDHVLPQVCL